MDQNTVLTIFVALAAVAMIGQAIALLGLFVVVLKIKGRVFAMWPQVEETVGLVKKTAAGAEKHVGQIGAASVSIVESAKTQVGKVDELLTDVSSRTKVQMERAEMVLDDTMTRVQSTVSVVQRGIVRPIREVHGIVNGVRTAILHLGRSSRSTVDHATSDEEMFI